MANRENVAERPLALHSETRHDVLNWLNQIIGYSEMLIEEADQSGQQHLLSDLGKINDAAQHLLERLEFLFSCSAACNTPVCGNRGVEHRLTPLPASGKSKSTSPERELAGKILVVDDNFANQEVLSRRLERQGHRVALAESGRQALARLAREPFDLVLLDVMMPDMDGYQALQQIKADPELHKVPVIMISACADIDQVINCIEIGAEDYLPKPFNSTLLKARISATLEKKRLREQELQLIGQALQAEAALERHRALTQAVAGVAHEINTPLGIVKTALSVIKNRLSLPEIQALFEGKQEHGELLQDVLDSSGLMIRNVDNAHRLIENFKKMAVDQVIEDRQTVDLPALLQDAIDLYRIGTGSAKLDIQLDGSGLTGTPAWHGYPGFITQILMNLLQNIERYAYPGGSGGKVDIRLSDPAEPGKSGQFMLTVCDYGAGIGADHLDKIFDPFFTTGRGKGGTGLGLAIVNNIVTVAMRGTVLVKSEPGYGTCFTICFPKSSEG